MWIGLLDCNFVTIYRHRNAQTIFIFCSRNTFGFTIVFAAFFLFMKKYLKYVVYVHQIENLKRSILKRLFFKTFVIVGKIIENNQAVIRKESKHFSEKNSVFIKNLEMLHLILSGVLRLVTHVMLLKIQLQYYRILSYLRGSTQCQH